MSSTAAQVALTNGDRLALASTALAILRLPGELQQRSNAYQMLDQFGVDQINKLVEDALAQRAELIAEDDAFAASEEYKEMVAKPEARDARRKGTSGPTLRLVQ